MFLAETVLEDGTVEGAEEAETPALAESGRGFFCESYGAVVYDELVYTATYPIHPLSAEGYMMGVDILGAWVQYLSSR